MEGRMLKKKAGQELREKYSELISNSTLNRVVKATQKNTDKPTNEEEYKAAAIKNITKIKSRIKNILS